MKKLFLLFVFTFIFSGCAFQTRWASRITGEPIDIALPEDCVKVINISFEPESKSVTCYDEDSNVFSQEYSDWGVFQGRVNWGKEKTVETPNSSEVILDQ